MRSRRATLLWIAAVAYAAAIFILSSQPVPVAGEEAIVLLGDTALHAAEYAGFAVLLTWAVATTPSPRLGSRAALVAFAAAVLYAASDEFHQTLVPGRQGSLVDLAADVLGAFLGAAGVHVWRWRVTRGETVSGISPR